MPAGLFIIIRSSSSKIISNLNLYGFNDNFFGSGIVISILSSALIFFEGSVKISPLYFTFPLRMRFFILVLLSSVFFLFKNIEHNYYTYFLFLI